MPSTRLDNDHYLTINEVCQVYSISRSTFYRMLADPNLHLEQVIVRIPPLSGNIRIPCKDFEVWLRQHRRSRSSRS